MAQDLATGDSRDKRAMRRYLFIHCKSKDSYLCAAGIDPSDYPSWTRELCITATIPSRPLLMQGRGWGEVRWSLYETRSKSLCPSGILTDLSRRSRCSRRPLLGLGQGDAMRAPAPKS